MADTKSTLDAAEHRRLGAALFNETWTLMELADRTPEQDEMMVHMAHASRYHWEHAEGVRPENQARGEWQISRVYAVLRRSEPALHHAGRCLQICEAHGIADFDLAFAFEALARAHAIAGHANEARRFTELATDAGRKIQDHEDRQLLEADVATIPSE
jgi:hypothetical protein